LSVTGVLHSADVIWIGDLNVKVGNDKDGIQGHVAEILHGGKLLRKMIKKRNLKLINATNKCKGLWTRVNTKNEDQKSVLDYVIATKAMENSMQNMLIDEDGLYVPTRFTKVEAIETDHRSIIITMTIPKDDGDEGNNITPTMKWNLESKAAIQKYKDATENSEGLKSTWRSHENAQEQYDHWVNLVKSILDSTCINKRKPMKRPGQGK